MHMLRNGERIAIKGRSYRLDGVLSNGAGSYGQVWAATDSTGRAVATDDHQDVEARGRADDELQVGGHTDKGSDSTTWRANK